MCSSDLRSVCIAESQLSLAAVSWGFSYCGAVSKSRWLREYGTSVGSMAHRLSCCSSVWYLSGPGIKPMFPALQGRFVTTGPPRKSDVFFTN